MVDPKAIDPLFDVVVDAPQEAGLISVDLSQHGVRLEPGVDYQWSVEIEIEPERPERNPMSFGEIAFVPSAVSKKLDAAGPADRGHLYASAGYWYDAFDHFAALAALHPHNADIARLTEAVFEAGRQSVP